MNPKMEIIRPKTWATSTFETNREKASRSNEALNYCLFNCTVYIVILIIVLLFALRSDKSFATAVIFLELYTYRIRTRRYKIRGMSYRVHRSVSMLEKVYYYKCKLTHGRCIASCLPY